jgi:hypothetical protein
MGPGHVRLRKSVVVSGVVVALLAAACGGGDDGGARNASNLPKGPKIDVTQPCSLLGEAQVAKVLGAPVTVDPTAGGSPITTDCSYVVGDPAAPVGTLGANIVFPALTSLANAVDVVESDRANAQIAGPGVESLEIGKAGFVQRPFSVVEVAASDDLGFSLQWFPAGGTGGGSPITPAVEKDLSALAADIAQRGR